MHTFFIALYYLIARNRILSVVLLLGLLCGSGWAISNINFEEDINQIIPKNEQSHITAKVLQQLNFSDKVVVIIENSDTSRKEWLTETADLFLEKMQPLDTFMQSIQGKVNEDAITATFDFVQAHLPLFLAAKDYPQIQQRIQQDSIIAQMEANYNALLSPTSLVTKEFILKDPLGLTFIGLQKLNVLNMGSDFRLEDGYIVSKDGATILLFIDPTFKGSDTKHNEVFVAALQQIQVDINTEFLNKTSISLYGAPVVAVSNAQQIKKDIQNTVFISLGLLLVLLFFYFKSWLSPLLVFLPTALAATVALGSLYFLKDRISAISLSIGAILIGITVDYALHILTHAKHHDKVEDLYKEICKPLLLSSATTAVSFLCLIFVKSEALKDLGIFAAITVMLSALFALIILPQLYRPSQLKKAPRTTFLDKMAAYPYERNRILIWTCSAFIIIGLLCFNKINFNKNISDLNYVSPELKVSAAKLEKLTDIGAKSIYTIVYGSHKDTALASNLRLYHFLEKQKEQGQIISFNSIGNVVLSEAKQQEKIALWQEFWNRNDRSKVLLEMEQAGRKYSFNTMAFDAFRATLFQEQNTLSLSDFAAIEALQLNEFITANDSFVTINNIVKVAPEQRAAYMQSVAAYPNVVAVDRQQMNEDFLGLLKDDFLTLLQYSLLAIALMIFGFFRNLELSVLTMVPIILTGIVTAGILYLFGIELNIFSTIVCTLVFGVGNDFSIFLTQAMQQEHTTGKNELPTYRTSILLAVLTTVLSIGSLIFAKHPALHSIASVAIIGMTVVIIITTALYPFWFRILIINRQQKGLSPITIRMLLSSVFSLTYYGIIGFVYSFLGANYVKKQKGKALERTKKRIASSLKSVLYSNRYIRKNYIANPQEDFAKPAVIIANHTSSIDTISLALATHKIVYLVNDWVYASPIFGKLVKALGFYQVSKGLDNGMDALREKVAEGYSLMIFPEGKRSYDNNVKRFHKGAFHIAEALDLDILPIYIHGNAEVMPKDDFIIYDGSVTVKVGDRISKDDLHYGNTVKERTQSINTFFRQAYDQLRTEMEDENYFKKKLLLSYLYKESDVVSAVKKDFEANATCYFQLNKLIAVDAQIVHLADDYGQLDVLLTLYQAGRKIKCYMQDVYKRSVAENNYIVKRRKIRYLSTLDDEQQVADVLLISDTSASWEQVAVLPAIIIFINTVDTIHIPPGYVFNTGAAGIVVAERKT